MAKIQVPYLDSFPLWLKIERFKSQKYQLSQVMTYKWLFLQQFLISDNKKKAVMEILSSPSRPSILERYNGDRYIGFKLFT